MGLPRRQFTNEFKLAEPLGVWVLVRSLCVGTDPKLAGALLISLRTVPSHR
jgi:hypothetical protein